MKTIILLIISLLAGITTLLQAQNMEQEMFHGDFIAPACYIEKNNIHFNKNQQPLFPSSGFMPNTPANRYDWLPVKGEYYWQDKDKIAGYVYNEFDENGAIIKQTFVCDHPNLYDSTVIWYNRTPRLFKYNMEDSVYNYDRNTEGAYIPAQRIFINHHYYDKTETDSFYREDIYQEWDAINQKWQNYVKTFYGFHDTLVQYYNRYGTYEGVDDGWKMILEDYDSLVYDANGHVVERHYKYKNGLTGDINYSSKILITNNEDGVPIAMNVYHKNAQGWELLMEHKNIIWNEWHGFEYSVIYFSGFSHATPYPLNKMKSQEIHYPSSPLINLEQKWWEEGPVRTNRLDTLWVIIQGEKKYRHARVERYDEYGNCLEYTFTRFYSTPSNILSRSSMFFSNVYDDEYGMVESFYYNTSYENNQLDTMMFRGVKYTDFELFTSISELPQSSRQPLSIAPNPVSGVATIAAATEIKQLQIFDITGKLMKEQVVSADKTVFDTGNLPKGIYIVQALLKNGERQTGKLVIP